MRRLSAYIFITLMVIASPAIGGGWKLPVLPPPELYGNLLIDRISTKNSVKPVTFSHWIHRKRYTCRVCHYELEFTMKINATRITEKESKGGKYCGAASCHDGKASFGHEKPHCDKCHNGNIGYGKEKFATLENLPRSTFGDKINWVDAVNDNAITPVKFLISKPKELNFDQTLTLEAEWTFVPPSIFPHKQHVQWLDCNNCHPEIFTIKKKGTKDFTMEAILKGEFCGVCHVTVAFPMNDCKRCHPGIKQW